MKNRGSAHLIIIVIASLLLIGAVSFTFYKVTVKNNTETTQTNSDKKIDANDSTNDTDNAANPDSQTTDSINYGYEDGDSVYHLSKDTRAKVGNGIYSDSSISFNYPAGWMYYSDSDEIFVGTEDYAAGPMGWESGQAVSITKSTKTQTALQQITWQKNKFGYSDSQISQYNTATGSGYILPCYEFCAKKVYLDTEKYQYEIILYTDSANIDLTNLHTVADFLVEK